MGDNWDEMNGDLRMADKILDYRTWSATVSHTETLPL